MTPSLVLASGSAIRAELLRKAALDFTVDAAAVDEDEMKVSFRHEGADASLCAMALAELKTIKVAPRHQRALVIGADQILVGDGRWFDKPSSLDQARDHLRALRGRRHELVTAVAVLRDGHRLWGTVERPALTMRDFSDAFLEAYLARGEHWLLASVGAYRLEGEGIQLFSRIEGDYFSILGLPLLPLLDFLRGHGALPR
jgi:septum formation protein